MPKRKTVPRGGAKAAPTDAYYAQLDQHPLRVRVSKATLEMLDDLVPLSEKGTKAQAVENAIAFAHKSRVPKKK